MSLFSIILDISSLFSNFYSNKEIDVFEKYIHYVCNIILTRFFELSFTFCAFRAIFQKLCEKTLNIPPVDYCCLPILENFWKESTNWRLFHNQNIRRNSLA